MNSVKTPLSRTSGGMTTFMIVWFGQAISHIGTNMTSFALGVGVYAETGSVAQFALVLLARSLPGVLISPLAGALVDRWDRRWIMIISDTGAAIGSLTIALLLLTDNLSIWHIYIMVAFSSAFGAFQWPAYAASTSLIVPKAQLGRASGLVQLAEAIGELVGPLLAGFLLLSVELSGILIIDFITFLVAVTTLLFVRFPSPVTTEASKVNKGSLRQEIKYGWSYISARQSLVALLIFAAIFNFFLQMSYVLSVPMVLNFASTSQLGILLTIGGVASIAGSGIMSSWGGPARRVYGLIGFAFLVGVGLIVAGLRPSILIFAIGGTTIFFCIPFVVACSHAIWLRKVAPDVQGRVFSVRRMITLATPVLAYVITGFLGDNVFEPLLSADGALASSIGRVIGVGPGRGLAVIMISMGLLQCLASIVGYLYPPLRLVEDKLPDAVPDKPATSVDTEKTEVVATALASND